ncbi:MAG: B12-binding domain-containing radical SAM protein, partial [Candidatus Electrothrix sp. GM3_4]|nr:B12-binding domain-containing radical SAM protein [Candidatus Electrothrix sp. GM3_4]
MRILYVQQYLGGDELLVMPIGLLYIATAASSHEAKLFDMNASKKPYEELDNIIQEYDPHVVALSLRNIDSQQRTNLKYYYLDLPKTLQLVKTAKSEVTLVVGGAGFSMFAETIMQRHHEIDFGVYLEGEVAFPALLENLQHPHKVPSLYYREGEELKFTGPGPLVDLEKLPIPRKDIIPDIKIYETGKGGVG